MSDIDIKTQDSSEPIQPSGEHELVAMVYRNEHNEVSYYSNSSDAESASQIDNGFSSIALIFVLSLVALVTISRRNTGL